MAEQQKVNEYFLSLIFSLSVTSMQQLGKTVNPITNKIEKNLKQAKISIDMLEMLVGKTKGNLTPEENEFLLSTVSNLQLNFVDELKKDSETEYIAN
ncbi:MAG: DUF1844 domain-containing protein [Elusimicrobiota bacterium]